MKKCLLCLLILCCVLPLWVFADNPVGGTVYDAGSYLTETEVQDLQAKIDRFYEKTGAKFIIYTTTVKNYDGETIVRQLGYSENDDLIIFGITHDYDGYHYYMDTYGDTYTRIDDDEFNDILDDPRVAKIKQSEFASALSAVIEESQDAYGTKNGRWVVCGVVGCLIAAIIALIAFFAVRRQYVRKLRGESYPLEHYTKLELQQSEDTYLRKNVTRTRISSGSSSRGGGRSGGGGGGGHRGGR